MTVSEASSRTALFVGDDSQVDFLFTFRVLSDEDLLVYMLDTDTDVTTLLTKDVDYTVTLTSGGVLGGKITMLVPPTTLERIRIYRDTPLDQEVDIPSQGNFTPSVINAALDKEVLALQEMKERTDRAIVVEPMSSDTPEELVAEMRAAITTANTAMAMAAAAVATANAAAGIAIAAAQAYINTALAGLFSLSGITGAVWSVTVPSGSTYVDTPYLFNNGILMLGGSMYNLSDPSQATLSTVSGHTRITLTAGATLVDHEAILVIMATAAGTAYSFAGLTASTYSSDWLAGVFTLLVPFVFDKGLLILGGSTYDFNEPTHGATLTDVGGVSTLITLTVAPIVDHEAIVVMFT